MSKESRDGDTFVSGCRNLDQSSLSVLEKHKERFCQLAVSVEIGKYGGSVRDRVAGNFASMEDSFRDTIERLRAKM